MDGRARDAAVAPGTGVRPGRAAATRLLALARAKFTRYSIASLIATGVSQLVLFVAYGWLGLEAIAASTIAFAVGALPHFALIRWWAWGHRGWPRLSAQLTGYLVVTVVGGAVSIVLTTAVDWLVGPLTADRDTRALLLNAAYVLSGLPVFLVKFAVLDRVFAQAEYDSTSSTRVRAANPVAPGTTSS